MKTENDLPITPDLLVHGVFKLLPVRDLRNAFLSFNKKFYEQNRNKIFQINFQVDFPETLRNELIHYFAVDKTNIDYPEIYRKSLELKNNILNDMDIACAEKHNRAAKDFHRNEKITKECFRNYLHSLSKSPFYESQELRKRVKLLPVLFSPENRKYFFPTIEENFDFWDEVAKFWSEVLTASYAIATITWQNGAKWMLGLLLFKLPLERVSPVKADSRFQYLKVLFTANQILTAFCYAQFSQQEINELVRVNPKIVGVLIDAIKNDNCLMLSFHIKNQDTLNFFFAFARDSILEKPLLVEKIKEFKKPSEEESQQYKQNIEILMEEDHAIQNCNNKI